MCSFMDSWPACFWIFWFKSTAHFNLIPRPHPAFRHFQYRKAGIFSHVSDVRIERDRKGDRKGLIVCGCTGPRTARRKRAKVVGNLLHISSYRVLNNIDTEHWSIVGWTTRETLPFCFGRILFTSCLCRKDTRLSVRYIIAFRESLGTRLLQPYIDHLSKFRILLAFVATPVMWSPQLGMYSNSKVLKSVYPFHCDIVQSVNMHRWPPLIRYTNGFTFA